ncbi:P-loop containing nucleoside triphosphate hydrolase protein [Xylariomycetidae sp. FL2044]|nr:P-loop containing nucleoside triphosphate hydrolase protein [Xylariomycetidae sp. FL2044]
MADKWGTNYKSLFGNRGGNPQPAGLPPRPAQPPRRAPVDYQQTPSENPSQQPTNGRRAPSGYQEVPNYPPQDDHRQFDYDPRAINQAPYRDSENTGYTSGTMSASHSSIQSTTGGQSLGYGNGTGRSTTPSTSYSNCIITAVPTLKEDQQPEGTIHATNPQRKWLGIDLESVLSVQPVKVERPVRKMMVEILESPRSQQWVGQNELRQAFISKFERQAFVPGQMLGWAHRVERTGRDIKLEAIIKMVELPNPDPAIALEDPENVGVLVADCDIEASEVFFSKAPSSTLDLEHHDWIVGDRKEVFKAGFKFENMGIGGLDEEFGTIFRRAFASRIFPPALVKQMGIPHVRGVLLYGPPGTGKTLIATKIADVLNVSKKNLQIINGPEVLNRYIGGSEEKIREMFGPAEQEWQEKGEASNLHIIIFDELEAVCKQRGMDVGGTGVGDSMVNQLLAKLDGPRTANNFLFIGMTNRKDMMDDALLRPGRIEVHVEISLPDDAGRMQILNIHTSPLRKHNRLGDDVNLDELIQKTKNYSGAEIQGLVKSATSHAFNRHTKVEDASLIGDVENIQVFQADFKKALEDIQPSFGVPGKELRDACDRGIIRYNQHIDRILNDGVNFAEAVRSSKKMRLFSVLIHGPIGAGKTALAADIALKSKYPFVKMITPGDIGTNEAAKLSHLRRVFSDAYKSLLSIVILDELDSLIEWNPIGPRFSNAVVHYIAALLNTRPPTKHGLLIIATTSQKSMLAQHGVFRFDRQIAVPAVKDHRELRLLLEASGTTKKSGEVINDDDITEALNELQSLTDTQAVGVGVKAVFSALETALSRDPFPLSFAEEMAAIMAG